MLIYLIISLDISNESPMKLDQHFIGNRFFNRSPEASRQIGRSSAPIAGAPASDHFDAGSAKQGVLAGLDDGR